MYRWECREFSIKKIEQVASFRKLDLDSSFNFKNNVKGTLYRESG